MKRWNGWGNPTTDYPLPASAKVYLTDFFGGLQPFPDTTLEQALATVPPSRLPRHPRLDSSAEARLTHARGQSLPDWVALRSGRIPAFPDGVAFPLSDEEVRDLLAWARQTGAKVIPYGGGTSVVGHINPSAGPAPTLTLSLERMTRFLELDEIGQTAVFEAGITGPLLEAALRQRGYTLGHFPQSHEYSTLGGWIAARSSGQQSYYYGRIEQLFLGGHVETPLGALDLLPLPASAAGPDVREMILGSEGRMGVITRACLRISRLPQAEEFHGVFFPTWEQGMAAVRQMAQERLPVSMLRLSNPQETETTLILSGKPWVETAMRGLGWLGYGADRSLLIFGVTGSAAQVRRTRRQAAALCRRFGGLFVGTAAGHTWQKNRFLSPYLRNTLWEAGVAVDTLETVIPWPRLGEASQAIPAAITTAMHKFDEKVLVFAHLSHIYRDAASLYTTFLFRRTADPNELLERWQAIKHAASLAIQQFGGTISHQHGVGSDHAPYLLAEKGVLGMQAIRAVCKAFDPEEMMNPGKLF